MSEIARATTHVAITMPVYNRRETTLKALDSLSAIDRTGLDVTIIVVDDGSTDGTSEAIRRRFPDVVLLHGDGTLHYAAGTNRGLQEALDRGAAYVIAMNDDTVVDPPFVQRLLACVRAHPRAIVGALLLLQGEPQRVFQVGPHWDVWYGGWHIPQHWTVAQVPAEPFEVEMLVGNCLMYPASVLREAGLMEEDIFHFGGSDAHFTTRLRRAGWRLLVEPRARVWCEQNTYPAPLRTLSLRQTLRILFVNEQHPLNLRRQFTLRWYSAPSRPQALAAFAVYLGRLGMKALGVGHTWPTYWADPTPPLAR